MSNGLDPDKDRQYVGPDLGSNCLQRFISRQQKLPLAKKFKVSLFSNFVAAYRKKSGLIFHVYNLLAGVSH